MFGSDSSRQQLVASQRESVEDVDDILLGARSFVTGADFETSLGVVRHAGYGPPLYFLTAETGGGRSSAWLEVGWWLYRDAPDRVNGVMGARQDFSSAFVLAEFIVEDSDLLLFLEEEMQLNPYILFDAQVYMYLNRYSAALKAGFTTDIDARITMELGTILFFGGEDSYFSRYNPGTDNHNRVYISLSYSI
jgi:hypothetical protein